MSVSETANSHTLSRREIISIMSGLMVAQFMGALGEFTAHGHVHTAFTYSP